MKALFKLHFDCGRNGELHGLFVHDKEQVLKLVKSEREVYFGDALGRHSNVCGPIEECDYTLVSEDEKVIQMVLDNDLEFGYNPFDYIYEDEE